MANVLLSINTGYNDQYLLSVEDALKMMDILSRSKLVSNTYNDNIYVTDNKQPEATVQNLANRTFMTSASYEQYKEAKRAPEPEVESE